VEMPFSYQYQGNFLFIKIELN